MAEKNENIENALITEYKNKIQSLETEKGGLLEKVGTLEANLKAKEDEMKAFADKITDAEGKTAAAVEDSNKKINELNDKLVASEKALAEIKAAELKANRISKLVEKGLAREEAESTVTKFENLNDEQFETIVAFVQPAKVEEKKEEVKQEEASAAVEQVIEHAKAEEKPALVADDKASDEKAEKAKAELVEFVKSELNRNKKNKNK